MTPTPKRKIKHLMSEKDDIQNRMLEISAFIDDANGHITKGEMVDLTGLDDEVASLCDRTVALPPQDAVTIQPLMAEMISKLEVLSQSLQDFQNKLKDQPQ